jgi:hypothetical protein
MILPREHLFRSTLFSNSTMSSADENRRKKRVEKTAPLHENIVMNRPRACKGKMENP